MTLSLFLNQSKCDRLRAWVYNSGGASYEVWQSSEYFSKVVYENDTKFIPKPIVESSLSIYPTTNVVSLSIGIYKTHSINKNANGNPFVNENAKKSRIVHYRQMKFELNDDDFWVLACGWSKNTCEVIGSDLIDCQFLETDISQMLVADNYNTSLPTGLVWPKKTDIINKVCLNNET
jgi:hypothetical protein